MSDNSDLEILPSWHDNLIYGIHWRCAEPDRGLWRSELVFDIDHILDWVPSGERCFKFLMAPAILVFHDAGDLEMCLDSRGRDGHRRYLNELSIHHIDRHPAADAPGSFRWRIDLNGPAGGRIGFDASRYSQILTAPACLCDEQRFPSEHRPPLTLAVLPEHLSVYQTSPELWEREAFEEQLDGAPEATGEPGKSSAGELGRLVVRMFFSAGAGLLAWSHMPVETAQ